MLLELRCSLSASGPSGTGDAGHLLSERDPAPPPGLRKSEGHAYRWRRDVIDRMGRDLERREGSAVRSSDPHHLPLHPAPRCAPGSARQGIRRGACIPPRDDRYHPPSRVRTTRRDQMDEDDIRKPSWILREFYNRMGLDSVRFKPSYYPYTEPSLDAEAYVEGIGWVEMGVPGSSARRLPPRSG